jgi:hypothetical protein
MTSTTPTQPSHNMRVYVDVPTPKDPKQRLLIAELNRSLKLTNNKQLVLNPKEKNASAKVLQPSKQVNQAPKDKKRPREDEKDAKDAPKKRRQVEQAQPLPVKQARVPLSADQQKTISVADPKVSFLQQTKLNIVDSKLVTDKPAVGPIMVRHQPCGPQRGWLRGFSFSILTSAIICRPRNHSRKKWLPRNHLNNRYGRALAWTFPEPK